MTTSDSSSDSTSPDRPVLGEAGVRHIAELARLHVGDAEVPELADHFERILDFVDTLKEVDVAGVEPLLHDSRPLAELRPDALSDSGVDLSAVFANAPDSDEADDDGRYFVTPRVV